MQTVCGPCLDEQRCEPHGFRSNGGIFKLAIALLFAGQSMIFSLAINLSPPDEPGVRLAVQSVILGATLIVLALLGGSLLHTAWGELSQGRLTIEILFVTTILGALLASLQSFLTGTGPIYFEVVSVLLVVYTFGKQVSARSRGAALAAARAWSDSLAACRRLDSRGDAHSISVTEVLPGDVVEVRPGELIPVDGVVLRGVGYTSDAAVSGEALAQVRRPGDSVLAGAASHDATFHIEVTAPGTERQVDQLLDAVENARRTPTSLQGQADRLAARFVPLIVATSLATFIAWTYFAGWQTGLFNAMAVLLVACPCALGLTVPIVSWTTLARLAERGLVIRNGDVIERLAGVDSVLFDKTGTLTEERMALADLATCQTGAERTRLLGWLAAVEAQCNHPVAKAFAQATPHAPAVTVLSLRTLPGAGVIAEIRSEDGNEHRLRVGRPEWLGWDRRPESNELMADLRVTSGQRIDVELDGRLAAIAILNERLRSSTRDALLELQELGLPITVLTGDTAERTAAVGLATYARTSLLPEDKRRTVIELLKSGGRPLFVGDGVNDASALAHAHASVSLASGADLANAVADATLHHGDLSALPFAVSLCRQAVATIRRNLSRAVLYNLAGITLAALGLLHPVVAALLMVTSSLFVAWSSARIGSIAEDCRCPEPEGSATWRPVLVAAAHGLALALQGLLAVALLDLSGPTARWTLALFTIAGCGLGWLWHQWERIPHGLDMTVGMLTFGNLGMLFGWWADLGFGPATSCCCGCTTPLQGIGMWLGMLLLGNSAMAIGLRRAPETDNAAACRWAMFGGGNLGMIVGMFAAGYIVDPYRFGVAGHLLAMSAGMTAGMLAGHLMTLRLFSVHLVRCGSVEPPMQYQGTFSGSNLVIDSSCRITSRASGRKKLS
jgi:heavy metal translocating P-type ATPase